MSDAPQDVQPTQGRPDAAITEADAPPSTPLDSAAEIPRVKIPWGSAGLEIDRGATPADVKEIQARIEAAVRIIDAPPAIGTRPDYVLAPLDHAELYAESAPELAERLRRSDLRITAESYVKRDAKANGLRAEFEDKSSRARNAVLVTTLAAALLVASAGTAAIPWLPAALVDWGVIMLSIATVAAGAMAAGWIQAIRGRALLERWMKARAEAESERLRYFSLLADETLLENPLLQLEYVRRYQLDVQRAYFDSRGDEHRRGADRQMMLIAVATALAGIAAGVGGVLGASIHTSWTSLAALGLVAQAFAARAENRLASHQSVRNAERYEQTRTALDELYRLLDRVREATATAGGDLSVMREYVTAIHDRLASEHRQWLDDTQLAGEAIARLESMIEESTRQARER